MFINLFVIYLTQDRYTYRPKYKALPKMRGNALDTLDFYNTHKLRSRVLTGMSCTMFFIALTLSLNMFFTGKYIFFAVLEYTYALFSIYIFYLCQKQQITFWHKLIYVYTLIAFICYAIFLGQLKGFILGWALLVPVISYLLLGIKYGLLTGLITLYVNLLIFSVQEFSPTSHTWINFVLAYSSIWAISHCYESVRATTDDALRELALKDNLTQCKNRLALSYQFDEIKQQTDSSELHLLLLDIDYFKLVNDTYGHDAGDDVLVALAERISTIVGDQDVYRIGGEEFCILLESQDKQQAIEVAEKIRLAIADSQINIFGKSIPTTVSIGIAHSKHTSDLTELLRKADISLYEAKRSGRNTVKYCDDLKHYHFE